MGKLIKNIILILIAFLVVSGIYLAVSNTGKVTPVSISQIKDKINDGKISTVSISDGMIVAEQKDSQEKLSAVTGTDVPFTTFLKDNGVPSDKISQIKIEYKNEGTLQSVMSSVLPFAIPFVLVGLLLYFFMRQVQGTNNRAMSFGQSSVRLADERKTNSVNA
jgi:cell division protease FtsH